MRYLSRLARFMLAAVMAATLILIMYLPAVIIMVIVVSGLLGIVFAFLSMVTGK